MRGGARLNVSDRDGETPLLSAAQGGHRACVDLLLAGGADVEAVDGRGINALHAAAMLGQDDCLKSIIRMSKDLKSEVNERDDGNPTSYMYCAGPTSRQRKKKERNVRFTNQGLAYLNSKTKDDGLSALHFAASEGHKYDTIFFNFVKKYNL